MNILLSHSSKTPLFMQMKDQIKEQIRTGVLHEGDALPSMRALAKELCVSVITTKRVYEELEAEGYLYSSVGRGTFVAKPDDASVNERRLTEAKERFRQGIQLCLQAQKSKAEIMEFINELLKEEKR